uniref:Uncharacterized protein n=1 Tax=Cacopsylla melanoneura TaxID=428564 RepID=A0A8D8Z8W7_9HEMI
MQAQDIKAPSTTARFYSVPNQSLRQTEPYQSQENLKQMDIDPNHSPWQIDLQSYSNSRYKTEFCRNMENSESWAIWELAIFVRKNSSCEQQNGTCFQQSYR